MTAAVKVSGAFFRGNVGVQTKKAVGKVVTEVAKVGKTELQAQLYPGHGRRSGAFRRTVKRRTRGLTARVWASNTMIAKWLQGGVGLIPKRKGSFRGYAIFDAATARTDATAGEEARKGVAELVRVLGGH